jgi:hypothetical protein
MPNRTIETINAELRREVAARGTPTADPETFRLCLDAVVLLATTRAIEIAGNHTAAAGSVDQFRLMLADLGNLHGALLTGVPSPPQGGRVIDLPSKGRK